MKMERKEKEKRERESEKETNGLKKFASNFPSDKAQIHLPGAQTKSAKIGSFSVI